MWEFSVKVLEKIKKFLMRMTFDTSPFNNVFMDQKGRHQASCPMPRICVGELFGLGGLQRQHGLSPIKCLDLGLFVNAYYKHVFGRIEVKTQYIRLLLLKLGIRTFPAPVFHLVWLQGRFGEYPLHCGFRNCGRISRLSYAPVATSIVGISASKHHNLHSFSRGDLHRPASSRPIFQAIKALVQKAFAPFPTSLPIKTDCSDNLFESQPSGLFMGRNTNLSRRPIYA